ncbi:MAG TPA: hypothetical protein VFP97_14495 [Chitinophagaceae bacterium]|nr:hypothetical protein [Chitinophagaceae bacterium]
MSRPSLLLLPIALFFSSCARTIEDHLIGEWKLDVTYRKELFGRDYFQTGYEDGVFTFFESGTATYTSSQDTLSGYWRSDFYTQWRDYADDDNDTERYKYLEVYLANFNRNKIIDWRFDNFNFRNSWKRIRAVEFSLGRDRYYEFVKP